MKIALRPTLFAEVSGPYCKTMCPWLYGDICEIYGQLQRTNHNTERHKSCVEDEITVGNGDEV